MYKSILLMVVLINLVFISFGQSVKSVIEIPDLSIKVLSGNPKYFKKVDTYHLRFDYSHLKVGEFGDERFYIEYMRDDAEKRKKGSSDLWEKRWYSARRAYFQPKFLELFNKFSGPGINVDTVFKNQQYVISIQTQFIEIGFNRNFKKSPTYINVIATIEEQNMPEKTLTISIENAIGNEVFSSYSDDLRRIEEAYAKCGKEMAKYMNRVIR